MKIVKNIFNLLLVVLILLFTLFITKTFAAVEYYSDGSPSKIVTDKGTITYYSNGYVKSIETSQGTALYNSSGIINSMTGNPSISLEEAKAELNKLKSTATSTTDSSLPNTGIESIYFFLIPIFLVLILISAIKLRNLKNI